MKELALKIFRNAAVRKAALGLLLTLLAAAGVSLGTGCGLLAAASPRAERFECQVRAIEPLAGDVLDARQLVLDLIAGKADLGAVLTHLKATPAEIDKLAEDLRACEGPPPAALPEGEPS